MYFHLVGWVQMWIILCRNPGLKGVPKKRRASEDNAVISATSSQRDDMACFDDPTRIGSLENENETHDPEVGVIFYSQPKGFFTQFSCDFRSVEPTIAPYQLGLGHMTHKSHTMSRADDQSFSLSMFLARCFVYEHRVCKYCWVVM